jgi:hypothetical protein
MTDIIIGYEVRGSSGYVRRVRDREEAVQVQLIDPRFEAIAVFADGTEVNIY